MYRGLAVTGGPEEVQCCRSERKVLTVLRFFKEINKLNESPRMSMSPMVLMIKWKTAEM